MAELSLRLFEIVAVGLLRVCRVKATGLRVAKDIDVFFFPDLFSQEPNAPALVVTGLLGNQPESQNWAGYAATEGGTIHMPHLMKASRREYQKLGRTLNDVALWLDQPAIAPQLYWCQELSNGPMAAHLPGYALDASASRKSEKSS